VPDTHIINRSWFDSIPYWTTEISGVLALLL